MTSLRSIYPLIPYSINILFSIKDMMMKLSLADRVGVIFFDTIDTFSVWQCTINDIMNKKLVENISQSLCKIINGIEQDVVLNEEMKEIDQRIAVLKNSKKELKEKFKKEKMNYEMVLPIQINNNSSNDNNNNDDSGNNDVERFLNDYKNNVSELNHEIQKDELRKSNK